MTSSNGNIFRVTGHLWGNSPVTGEFPAQRTVTRTFDVFFDLRLNRRLSKQWWGWWFEMLWCPLWRHCNVSCIFSKASANEDRRYACNAFSQQLKPCSAPVCSPYHQTTIPENKVNGANMGLIWGRQEPGGPHVGPMKLAIRDFANIFNLCILRQSFDDCKGL